jgi:hypothetical protein
MMKFVLGGVIGSIALLSSCTPAGQSGADSVAAAQSSTPVGAGIAIPDSAALAAAAKAPSQPASGAPKSTTKPAGATTKPPGATTKPQVKAPIVDDDIVGRDSVINDRFRVVPRPSATPTR